jgi:nitrogen regulatory protein P-II 1
MSASISPSTGREPEKGIPVKMVQAVLRPEKLDAVMKALEEKNLVALTVTNVCGRGEQKGIALEFRGVVTMVDLLPKVKIELVVQDSEVETAIATIRANARTGAMGDGKIFVLPVEVMARVRTDEAWH